MVGDDTDDGCADFAVVVPVVEMVFLIVGAGAFGGGTVMLEDQFAPVVGAEFGAVGQTRFCSSDWCRLGGAVGQARLA